MLWAVTSAPANLSVEWLENSLVSEIEGIGDAARDAPADECTRGRCDSRLTESGVGCVDLSRWCATCRRRSS
jgi:hypothetical protein